MIFSLDVRRARKGDCLLLHYGSKNEPGLAMIDGGPKAVYEPHLKPRIAEIAKARKIVNGRPLPVDLLMVSHVDDDHIQGILDLTRELLDDQRDHRPPLVKIADFWHNSFDKIVDGKSEKVNTRVKAQFGEASVSGAGELSDEKIAEVEDLFAGTDRELAPEEEEEVVSSALKVLASIGQGVKLLSDAKGLGLIPNARFKDHLIVAGKGNAPVTMKHDLSFTVAGPLPGELEALRKKHIAWLRDHADEEEAAALAAYVDTSVANLSSLVLVAECGGRKMLLTGDARGDKVLKGLELVGAMPEGGKLDVDLLKVPHHGSARNLDDDFFDRIAAKHYVFSGNGEHGNPERESLEMLFAARGGDDYAIHLTYPVAEIDEAREKDWHKEQGKEKKKKQKHAKQVVRPDWSPADHSLGALFGKHPDLAAKVRIVDKTKPHVIDLLDPLGY